jgi:hypothetical protein
LTPVEPGEGRTKRGPSRLLWFVLIYAGSLSAFAALVYGLRALVP